MALIDEQKLQGNVFNILEILRKKEACCKVASTTWATSSVVSENVFVVIFDNGQVEVYTGPSGTKLTPTEYGDLSYPT